MPESPDRRARSQQGFTLVEVTVSLMVTVIVLLGVLALFDFSNKLSRVQTNIADMQQSLRVGQADAMRMIRMAGRGGLPAQLAVTVRDNVGSDKDVQKTQKNIVDDPDAPEILPGSDVLTVRGVLSSSIYQVNTADPAAFVPPGGGVTGKIRVSSTTPTSIPQNLKALKDAVADKRPEALLLVSARNAAVWAVVELDWATSEMTDPDLYVLHYKIAGGNADKYVALSSGGAFPAALTAVAYVGILEESRFYVRREFSVRGNAATDLTPKLSRARVYPGTDVPWGGDADNLQLDIADNVFDLQVALGIDSPFGGSATYVADAVNGAMVETANGEADDWLYNGEAASDQTAFQDADGFLRLEYIRLSTLARTDRRDRDYAAPTLVRVEDHDFTGSSFNSDPERMYRRRVLRTVIDMRNLG
jgi:type II secretory pathway pseudopilin PulG